MVASSLWCPCLDNLSAGIICYHTWAGWDTFPIFPIICSVDTVGLGNTEWRKHSLSLRNLPPRILLGKRLGNVLCCKGKWIELLHFWTGTVDFDFVLSGKNKNQVSGLYQAQCMLSRWAFRHICGSQVLGEELKGWKLLATSAYSRLYLPAVSSCSRDQKLPGTDNQE